MNGTESVKNSDIFCEALNEISSGYISEALSYKAEKKTAWIKLCAIAACIALFAFAGVRFFIPDSSGADKNLPILVFGDDTADLSENTQMSYETEIMDNPGSGEPTCYEELRDGYLVSFENLSFISYEITAVYSPEEAYELTGNDIFTGTTTLYNAHVFYDHLLNTDVDYYINIAHAGNAEKQLLGKPMYEKGMRFVSAVFGDKESWRVPVGELEFLLIEENGTEKAYHIGADKAALDSYYGVADELLPEEALPPDENQHPYNIWLPVEEALAETEKRMYFGAVNNPMLFVSKSDVGELVEFIRNDWFNAGIADPEGNLISRND